MAGLTSVDDALASLLAGGRAHPRRVETVPVQAACGRVLAADLAALRTQPPADMSAMDGFALRAVDAPLAGTRLRVIGESAAGHPFAGEITPAAPSGSLPAPSCQRAQMRSSSRKMPRSTTMP